MTSEQLEFTIAQYAADAASLTPDQRSAVEAAVGRDAGLRALLASERKLNDALRQLPAPDVNFDALLAKVSAAVADEPAHAAAADRGVLFRIVRSPMRLAAAAAVLIAAGVAVPLVRNASHPSPAPGTHNPAAGPTVVIRSTDNGATDAVATDIKAGDLAAPAGAPVGTPTPTNTVAIAPGPANGQPTAHFAEANPRPGRVEIGGDKPSTQSSAVSPF
jgi:anti-sigma factor RsiW